MNRLILLFLASSLVFSCRFFDKKEKTNPEETQNDSNYVLKWEPKGGQVALSGELGFTYGVYALRPADKDTLMYGNYVSIWKKQSDGSWKYILDSGNEGIGNE
ncbi:MAG: hypothetical protein IPP31_09725 [Chitinophagaceae bacterium]|nr:hypothetical protein [Chitinophagaceae bacterium]